MPRLGGAGRLRVLVPDCVKLPDLLSTAVCCSVNPDELLLRMGEYDLNDEFPEPYTFQDRKVQIVAR